jgi:hypothetical protein
MSEFALRSAWGSACGSAPRSGCGSLRPIPEIDVIADERGQSSPILAAEIFIYAVTVGCWQ